MKPGNSPEFERMMARAEQRGWKRLPPDHPIFSEGPSITLSSRTRGQSQPKATTSAPVVSPNVSPSMADSENTSSNS